MQFLSAFFGKSFIPGFLLSVALIGATMAPAGNSKMIWGVVYILFVLAVLAFFGWSPQIGMIHEIHPRWRSLATKTANAGFGYLIGSLLMFVVVILWVAH